MYVGVQFQGSLPANATQRWFTFNWPAEWDVAWMVVPTSPQPGAPELEWTVAVERASASMVTYWITIHNLTGQAITMEARFVIFNIGGAALASAANASQALPARERHRLEGGSAPALDATKLAGNPGGSHALAQDAGSPSKEVMHAAGRAARASSTHT